MKKKDDSERVLIQYLLGQLPEAEQTRLEERFFADDAYFERLLAVEDDLIDDYVRGELSPHEHERFERAFLTTPERHQRVEFARALMRTVSEAPVRAAPAPARARPEPASGWPSLRAFLRRQNPAFQFAIAAAALIILVGGAWLMVEMTRLQTQLAQLQAERQAWQQQEQTLRQEVARARARQDELAEQLQREQSERARLEQELAAQPPSRPAFLSFVLSRVARDPGEAKKLVIPSGPSSVQLQIDLEAGDDYPRYRAGLQTAEGHEIWSQDGLLARLTNWGKAVVLRLPANLLTPGDYELGLRGVAASGTFVDIGYYYFSVVKR
jgi:anti-sigma factor RsiW